MDLYGSLPVNKRWPGEKAVRKMIGRKLGAELDRTTKRA